MPNANRFTTPLSLRTSIASLAILATSCTGKTDETRAPAAQLTPQPDITPSSIVRITTPITDGDVHHLREELRVASSASSFTNTQEFVVGKAGSLWVYDDPSNSIFIFDSTGKFVRKAGRDGNGPGEFKMNSGMVAMRGGRVAHYDDANDRVSFLSATGDFEDSWHFTSGAVRRRALVSDSAGQLYIKRTVYADATGNAPPASREVLLRVPTRGQDTIPIPDLHIPELQYELGSEDINEKTTMSMVTNATYMAKELWDWHPDGYLVLGHGALYQITVLRNNAPLIRIDRSFTPIAVDADERKAEELSILGNPGRKWKGPPLPKTKPPLMDLFVARDGRIWARVPMPSVRTTVANADRKPGAPPTVAVFRTPVVWEVFTTAGAFLGRVAFPGRTELMQADGNLVWAIDVDDDDVPSLVRYRVDPVLR